MDSDISDLEEFVALMRKDHFASSSLAYRVERNLSQAQDVRPPITVADDYYLIRSQGRIISCVQTDTEGRLAILSNAETLPEYQRRGTFWRFLGIPIIRRLCDSGDFDRIEATTWTFNRKGIPVYKRFGFRAVPDTSLHMVNYLPAVIHHPEAKPYFEGVDYIRYLQNKRSYGYDAIEEGGQSVFEYRWQSREGEELRVLVDWRTHGIVSVQRTEAFQGCGCKAESIAPGCQQPGA